MDNTWTIPLAPARARSLSLTHSHSLSHTHTKEIAVNAAVDFFIIYYKQTNFLFHSEIAEMIPNTSYIIILY